MSGSYEAERLITEAIDEAYARFGDASMGGSKMTGPERFAVLAEEVGELAREVVTALRNVSGIEPDRHGKYDRENLRLELSQIAACATMWLEAEFSDYHEVAGVTPPGESRLTP